MAKYQEIMQTLSLDPIAITTKPLTNLVIPEPADPVTSTEQLIVALGKLQGQINYLLAQTKGGVSTVKAGTTISPIMKFEPGELLATPQNGAWEWDGSALYFTTQGIRQKVNKEYDFNNPSSQQAIIRSTTDTTVTAESHVTPAGMFSNQNGVTRLNILLDIYLFPEAHQSEFSVKTELFLNIKNGLFSNSYTGFASYTSLKIAEVVGLNLNGPKELELPVTSSIYHALPQNSNTHTNLRDLGMTIVSDMHPSALQSTQWCSLKLFGVSITKGVKKEFIIPEVFLRNLANTKAFGAGEASFTLTLKASLKTTIPGATLASMIEYYVTIKSFTIEKIK
jgi:hypothetical protein